MALPAGLVRTSEVARLLGVDPRSVAAWCRTLGIPLGQAPVRGSFGRCPTGRIPAHSPYYLSIDRAGELLELMLPGLANVAARKAAHVRLVTAARRQRQASSNVVNELTWLPTGVPEGKDPH